MSILQEMTFVAFITTLTACEGTTTQDWIVDNRSSQRILVEADVPMSHIIVEPTFIEPDNASTIATTDMRGASRHAASATSYIGSMVITLDNGDTISLDPMDNANWVSNTDRRRRVPSHWHHGFRLVIVDSDL